MSEKTIELRNKFISKLLKKSSKMSEAIKLLVKFNKKSVSNQHGGSLAGLGIQLGAIQVAADGLQRRIGGLDADVQRYNNDANTSYQRIIGINEGNLRSSIDTLRQTINTNDQRMEQGLQTNIDRLNATSAARDGRIAQSLTDIQGRFDAENAASAARDGRIAQSLTDIQGRFDAENAASAAREAQIMGDFTGIQQSFNQLNTNLNDSSERIRSAITRNYGDINTELQRRIQGIDNLIAEYDQRTGALLDQIRAVNLDNSIITNQELNSAIYIFSQLDNAPNRAVFDITPSLASFINNLIINNRTTQINSNDGHTNPQADAEVRAILTPIMAVYNGPDQEANLNNALTAALAIDPRNFDIATVAPQLNGRPKLPVDIKKEILVKVVAVLHSIKHRA